MEVFDFNELLAMIIGLITLICFPIILKKRQGFTKYIPGIGCLIVFLVANALEEFVFHQFLDIIETITTLVAAVFLLIAALLEFHNLYLKERLSSTSKKNQKDNEIRKK